MMDRNQTIKVRIKAASLLGFLAKYNSLGKSEHFENFFIQNKLRPICQDLNWEVRKEMCMGLLYISKYIGQEKS